jgi:4-hydroxybenzoate polyprenyltransferase
VLAGAAPTVVGVSATGLVLSLAYVGGMFLNDAFDAEIDARERPERPIPSGRVSRGEVFGVGFGLLGTAVALLALGAALRRVPAPAVLAGAVLAGLVVLYDVRHKGTVWAPVVMGGCRAASYVTAGLAAGGTLGAPLVAGALGLGAYVVGLTFVARQENRRSYRAGATLALLFAPLCVAVLALRPPSRAFLVDAAVLLAWIGVALWPLFRLASPPVGRSVVRLIAGISLVDALFVAATGAPALALCGAVGLGVTLLLQRFVSGT